MKTSTLQFVQQWRAAALVVLLLACLSAWLMLAWQEQKLAARYHLIEDGLYLGEAVPEPPLGTQAVVNLCGRDDDYNVEYELHRPVYEQGNVQPTLAWLEEVVEFIDEHRQAERTVFVHCQSGVNRSGAAVTAYLMQKHGWTRDEALRFVQKQRRQVGPNPQLLKLLADWEKHLATKYTD